MSADFAIDINKAIDNLLKGPEHPDKEFVRAAAGVSFAEVYSMAASLRAQLAGPEHRGAAVCLATDNKAIIAAALLASLAGDQVFFYPMLFQGRLWLGCRNLPVLLPLFLIRREIFLKGYRLSVQKLPGLLQICRFINLHPALNC